jgi:hypothetical protein
LDPLQRLTAHAPSGKTRQLSWGLLLFSATEPEGFTHCGGLPRPPLRSVFRVSRPLDGFHPPEPTRPSFVPGALLRFSLRGLTPPDEPHSSRSRCFPVVGGTSLRTEARWECCPLGPEAFLPSEIRACEPRKSCQDAGRCLPGISPSEAFPPPAGALRPTLSPSSGRKYRSVP